MGSWGGGGALDRDATLQESDKGELRGSLSKRG